MKHIENTIHVVITTNFLDVLVNRNDGGYKLLVCVKNETERL